MYIILHGLIVVALLLHIFAKVKRPVHTINYIELRLTVIRLKLDSIDFDRVRTWTQR